MKTNAYEKFDKYGLQHLAEHLYNISDFKNLFSIANDVSWFNKRRERDLFREGYQRDLEFAINYANSNIEEQLSSLLSLKYLNGVINYNSLRVDPENIETLLIVGNLDIVNELEERIIDKINSPTEKDPLASSDIEYLIDRSVNLLETNQPLNALPYFNNIVTALSKGIYNRDSALFILKKKIAEFHLDSSYLEKIEPLWRNVNPFWKHAFNAWERFYLGDITSAEESASLAFDALSSYGAQLTAPDFTEARRVNGLRIIAELHREIFGREEAYNTLGLVWQEALYTNKQGQARGAAFRELALDYAKLGYLTKAINALKEIPKWLRFVQIEWLEKTAVEMHKTSRSSIAKVLLLESLNHRINDNSDKSGWLSSSFLNALAKIGYKGLASDGLAVYIGGNLPVGRINNDWCNINALQKILSKYLKDDSISWFEILESRDTQEKSLPQAKGINDIRKRAEIIIKEFRHQFDQIYRTIEDAQENNVESFYASNPNQFLELNKSNLSDAINSVSSATEYFGWNLIIRILICHAIINCNPSSEELSHWLKLIVNQQNSRNYNYIDTGYDLIFYAPLLARAGLLESVLSKINKVKEFYEALKVEQDNFLKKVKNTLLDDLSSQPVTLVRYNLGQNIDLQSQLTALLNEELENASLPIILSTKYNDLIILDLAPDDNKKIENILYKYGFESEIDICQRHVESFVAFLS